MSDLLSIGKTGLFVSKRAMETTGHNISNVNTEGFSRQHVRQTTGIPIQQSGLNKGTGSRIVSVNRAHDEYIEKRLNKEVSDNEYLKNRSIKLEQIEGIFNEINSEGLNTLLNKFFNSFKELANQPENETMKLIIRDSAKMLVKDFQRINSTLIDLSKAIDQSFRTRVTDINTITKNLAKLNKDIVKLEKLGGETGDLRDQRDLLIRDLSKLIKIHTYKDNNNNYVINAKGVGTLVAATEYVELHAGPATKENSTSNRNGSIEIYYKDRPTVPLTELFAGGEISSLAKIRNSDINSISKKINNLAFDLTNIVNAVHRRGYVSRPIDLDTQGNPVKVDSQGITTGINFFEDIQDRDNAIAYMKLSDNVIRDATNISTGILPNSSGDNRISLAISKIQHEKILNKGTATLEEEYLHTISQIGIEASKSRFDLEQSEGILAQTKNIRERLVGVSLDEEAANLMRYQHAYAASAKVMKTAEEMFKTILSIKR